MQNYRKLLLMTSLLFCNVTLADIAEFKQSWTAQALRLQDKIDLEAPINTATILGTHNSYNAKSYATKVRYTDPNQLLSIYDQLEMGIRSIELDAHWAISSGFKKDILLCHAGSTDICSPYDRTINEGLQEIQSWLKANSNEIILLYIERHVDGHEPRLAASLEKYLGEYIYKPSVLRSETNTTSCMSIPSNLTKAQVLREKKQVLIVTKECADSSQYKEENQYKINWHDISFAGIGDIPNQSFSFIDGKIEKFKPYPDCGKSLFKADKKHTSMWRIYEDRRESTNQNDKHIEDKDLQELMSCNINWQAFDMLQINDSRLTAAIWSWAQNYPTSSEQQCAIYELNVGIKNISCHDIMTDYVCRSSESSAFNIVTESGAWRSGYDACKKTNSVFATPINALELNKIKNLMITQNKQRVWLNYSTDSQGRWVANSPLS